MDSEWLGIGLLIAMVVAGVPIWLALGVGGSLALMRGFDLDPQLIVSMTYNHINNVTLLSVPLFLLVGETLSRGGCAKPVVRLLISFMGHIPGGPAYVVIVACMIFAAMSSGGMAFIAGFGPLIIPMMMEMGYSKRFSIGLVVTAASLGVLIPPSIPLIVYGFVTETSVKDLYSAAFVPGGVLALLLALTVFFQTRRGHYQRLAPASWAERWAAFKEGWPALLMPPLIVIPIYTGVCTPTESASIAVVYSLFLGIVVYRKLSVGQLWQACISSGRLFSMLMMILATAFMLNQALVFMRVPFELGDALIDANMSWALFMFVVIIAFTLMGMFLDTNALLIIAPPILLPALIDLGYDPIVFGVVTVIAIELAIITPPFGMALFVAAGVLDEDFETVTRACFLFYPAMIAGLLLIALVPDIALWLT